MSTSPITFANQNGVPLPERHHLSVGPRGKFVLKITIATDPKLVGRRLTFPLRTADPGLALLKREIILETLHRTGLLSRDVTLIIDRGEL